MVVCSGGSWNDLAPETIILPCFGMVHFPKTQQAESATGGGPFLWGCTSLLALRGDPVLQRPQADPQHLGGALAVAAHVFKREPNVRILDLHERLAGLEDDRSV